MEYNVIWGLPVCSQGCLLIQIPKHLELENPILTLKYFKMLPNSKGQVV